MEPQIIRGSSEFLPSGSGYGDGYGYGYGDGYGSGDGSGYGYGYGYDITRCSPSAFAVDSALLKKFDACSDQARLFVQTFPNGATWPGDIEKARAVGLDLEWARKNLGLLVPQ